MGDKEKVSIKYYSPFLSGLGTHRQNIKSQVLFPPKHSQEGWHFQRELYKDPRETQRERGKQDPTPSPGVKMADIFQPGSEFMTIYMTVSRATGLVLSCTPATGSSGIRSIVSGRREAGHIPRMNKPRVA